VSEKSLDVQGFSHKYVVQDQTMSTEWKQMMTGVLHCSLLMCAAELLGPVQRSISFTPNIQRNQ
jgi:hypothetical protein